MNILTNFDFLYGTIWPICAESVVKPQPTNLRTSWMGYKYGM